MTSRSLLLTLLLVACDESPAPVAAPAPVAPAPVAAPVAAPADAAPPDAARAGADAAFNDAMRAFETGDAENAKVLLPKAVEAYRALPQLDADGMFHLSLLQLAQGDAAGARATADLVLEKQPRHLLALGAAARALTAAGDTTGARAYQQRLLTAYDAEQGAQLEYGHHSRLLPIYQAEARTAVAQAVAGSVGIATP